MGGELTLEQFMKMNPKLVSALKAAEDEFRSSYSKRIMPEDPVVEDQPFNDLTLSRR